MEAKEKAGVGIAKVFLQHPIIPEKKAVLTLKMVQDSKTTADHKGDNLPTATPKVAPRGADLSRVDLRVNPLGEHLPKNLI